MITSLYDQREADAIREENSRERNRILKMQPAPKCRMTRYRSAQLVRYFQAWNGVVTAWRNFRDSVAEDIYWYDMTNADWQAAKTERRYIYDLLRGRGWVYLGNQWVDPDTAAQLDKCDGWETYNADVFGKVRR